ncbi:hypothetical protein C8J57DRAFT_1214698 [Mycena rebaudengoi]|nr:hypothetical protein C8J57DRAFT_1214698 [Mycena rebaudengoi]
MFDNCNNVTIQGGLFVVNPRQEEEDYFPIRVEHLDLLEHIATENIVRYVVSSRRRSTGRAKRVRVNAGTKHTYRASVFPSSKNFTAVVYEGQGSAQLVGGTELKSFPPPKLPSALWCHMIHANVALAQCRRISRLHEAYFMQQMYHDMSVWYIIGLRNSPLIPSKGATQYWWHSASGNNLFRFNSQPYVELIRASTGRLCIDILHQSDSDFSGIVQLPRKLWEVYFGIVWSDI